MFVTLEVGTIFNLTVCKRIDKIGWWGMSPAPPPLNLLMFDTVNDTFPGVPPGEGASRPAEERRHQAHVSLLPRLLLEGRQTPQVPIHILCSLTGNVLHIRCCVQRGISEVFAIQSP